MARIRELVPHMKDLETPDARGRTALHRAAEFGQAECVALLLRHGAKVQSLGALGLKPPILFRPGRVAAAEPRGREAQANAVDNAGATPLLCAVREGRAGADTARALLRDAACDAAHADPQGNTSLHLAAAAGRSDLVTEIVLAASARVAAAATAEAAEGGGGGGGGGAGEQPGGGAARARLDALLDATNAEGRSALMEAVKGSKVAAAEALLAAGSNVNTLDPGGRSVMFCASPLSSTPSPRCPAARAALGNPRRVSVAPSHRAPSPHQHPRTDALPATPGRLHTPRRQQ